MRRIRDAEKVRPNRIYANLSPKKVMTYGNYYSYVSQLAGIISLKQNPILSDISKVKEILFWMMLLRTRRAFNNKMLSFMDSPKLSSDDVFIPRSKSSHFKTRSTLVAMLTLLFTGRCT